MTCIEDTVSSGTEGACSTKYDLFKPSSEVLNEANKLPSTNPPFGPHKLRDPVMGALNGT